MQQVDEDIAEAIRYLRGRQAHYQALYDKPYFVGSGQERERDTWLAIADELHDIIETLWNRFDTSGEE